MVRGMRLAGLTLALVATVVVSSGCSGPSDPPKASPGFFPATYSGATVANAPLVKSGEVSARTTHLTFHVSVPDNQAWVVVIRCEKGRVEARFGGAREEAPCQGLSFLDNGCAGIDHTETVQLSEPQSESWGVALYTGRDVGDTTCK